MAVGYCCATIKTPSEIDELLIDNTHTVVVQFFSTEWCDVSATECVVLVPREHSRLSGIPE